MASLPVYIETTKEIDENFQHLTRYFYLLTLIVNKQRNVIESRKKKNYFYRMIRRPRVFRIKFISSNIIIYKSDE